MFGINIKMSSISYTCSERMSEWRQSLRTSRPETFIQSKETCKVQRPDLLASLETRKVGSVVDYDLTEVEKQSDYARFSNITQSVELNQPTITLEAPLLINSYSLDKSTDQTPNVKHDIQISQETRKNLMLSSFDKVLIESSPNKSTA